MNTGKLFVFSAPSGSGKTTLVHHLLQQNLSLGFSISATSRPPRANEVDGKDYYFLSRDTFHEKIAAGEFIEYEEVYKGTFYGTLKSEIKRLWESGKHVVFDIDVKGGLNIKSQYPVETLAVFIHPPSLEELEKRLRKRGTESDEKIKQRLDKSASELTFSQDFDVILINDDLFQTKQEVVRLVKKHLNS